MFDDTSHIYTALNSIKSNIEATNRFSENFYREVYANTNDPEILKWKENILRKQRDELE